MTKVEMARTLQRIRKVQNDIKTLKDELEELKNAVKTEMIKEGAEKWEAGGCIATCKEEPKNNFSVSELKEKDRATYDKYYKRGTTMTLRVK